MSNNNDGGGCGLLILLLAFGYILLWIIFAVAVAAYAVMCFWAIILTLISLVAWNRPRRFFHLGITPYQARAMVCFGIVGTILLPAFGLFCEYLFEFRIDPRWWFYLCLGGYAWGCVGFSRTQTFRADEIEYFYLREQPALPAPDRPQLPGPKTFEYADWQDPQELGRS